MSENSELVERTKELLYDRSIRTMDETVVQIIALCEADVRERLLSDGAKTAAGKNLYNNRVIELDQAGDDDWDILPWQDEWIEGAQDVLHAALIHIGIESEEPADAK